MAKAKKLPSGSWRCQVYDYTDSSGKRHYKSFTCSDTSAKGKRICEQMAANYAADKESHKYGQSLSTLSTEMNSYLSIKESVLSPSTYRSYRSIKRKLEENFPKLCSTRIIDITQNDIQHLINTINKTLSPKTVSNYHGFLSAVIGSNLNLHTTMPKRVRPELYIPSDDEIRRLVESVRNTELEIPVLLAAFCTMRRGEICALQISDITGNIIHVNKSMVFGPNKEWIIKPPKTSSSDRFIDAPDFVIDRINEIGHITNLDPSTITKTFGNILDKNNITHFRFHDLRHYSASVQHAIGIPDAYIMQRGGWSTDTVLKQVYRHAMSDRQKEMSNKTNDYFKNVIS